MVAAVEAGGGGAAGAVMAGIVAGDAADDGALDAALGVGGGSRATDEKYGGDGGEGFHGSMSPDAGLRPQRARAVPVPRSLPASTPATRIRAGARSLNP